ncbi:MAG: hypothetical protein ACI837_000521 [Crocinitomicaceae bacterium]|jgi:hypothetical protein
MLFFQLTSFGQTQSDLMIFDDFQLKLLGLKTRLGDTIWPPQFDDIIGLQPDADFHYKYWLVWQKDQCGLLDEDGMMILPVAYSSIRPSRFGQFIVGKNGQQALLNGPAKVVVPYSNHEIHEFGTDHYSLRMNGRVGLVDLMGQQILPSIYDSIGRIYQDDLFSIYDKSEKTWSVVDTSGRTYIEKCERIYQGAWSLIDSLAHHTPTSNRTLYGLKEGTLHLLYHGKFRKLDSTIQHFPESLKLLENEESILIDKAGKVVFKSPLIYHPSKFFYCSMENTKLILINHHGTKKDEHLGVRAWIFDERGVNIYFVNGSIGLFDPINWKWIEEPMNP